MIFYLKVRDIGGTRVTAFTKQRVIEWEPTLYDGDTIEVVLSEKRYYSTNYGREVR